MAGNLGGNAELIRPMQGRVGFFLCGQITNEKEFLFMLDLKFVRENPEIVKQNIRNKVQDQKLPLVDEVIALDAENRRTPE